jgi:hypothetical protein
MKLKFGFSVIVLLIISTLSTYAQTLPCNGSDDDGTCPLDTWVILLVAFVSIFVAFRLYRRKKSSIQPIQ